MIGGRRPQVCAGSGEDPGGAPGGGPRGPAAGGAPYGPGPGGGPNDLGGPCGGIGGPCGAPGGGTPGGPPTGRGPRGGGPACPGKPGRPPGGGPAGGGPGRRGARDGQGTDAPIASTRGRIAACIRWAASTCASTSPCTGSGTASSSASTGAPWPRSASAAATRACARSRGSAGSAAWSTPSSRRANSRIVNVLRSARGSSSSTAERCERLTVSTRSASSTSRAGSWRARKAATSGCEASGPSWARESGCISAPTTAPVPPLATSNHDAHRGPSRISSSARAWKRANGERQMFPVQTNRSRKRRGDPSPRPFIRPIVAVVARLREPSPQLTCPFGVRTPRRRARTALFRGVATPVRRPVATTAPVRYSCSRGRPARRS